MAFAYVDRVTALTISNNTRTKVTGLSQVDASAGGVWNNGNQNFVAQADGWHEIVARVEWAGEQGGAHLVEAVVNGSERVLLSQVDGDWSVTATTGLVHGGVAHVDLTAGDTVDLRVRQISGGSTDLAAVHEFLVRGPLAL